MASRYPICACAEYYGEHHPECPVASRLAAADRLYLDLKSRHPVFTKGCHTCEAIAAYEAAGKGDITDRETGDAETAGPSGWPRAPLNDKISLRDVRPSAETRTTDLESRLADYENTKKGEP